MRLKDIKEHDDLECIVELENNRIVAISKDARILEYIDGKWVKPTAPVYGADFYEGKPIEIDRLRSILPKDA